MSVEIPEGAQITWAKGIMVEVPQSDSFDATRIYAWPSAEGEGSPLIWFKDQKFTWVYFGAQNPQTISDKVLSRIWVESVFDDPAFARQLTGVFAFVAIDRMRGRIIVFGDRLGVQPLYYARDEFNPWRISTHLMWLLLANRHDGTVNQMGFLAHMTFGYSVSPYGEVYKNVQKLPPAGYLVLEGNRAIDAGVYWSQPKKSKAFDENETHTLVKTLGSAMASSLSGDGICLGLTAGKDSLCLASAVNNKLRPTAGTFGVDGCADHLQAEEISSKLGFPWLFGGVCPDEEFSDWATYIAFHSAGLATISYVDMAYFAGNSIKPNIAFVIGEGGECVRDFFVRNGQEPLTTLQAEYMTPFQFLQKTLPPALVTLLGSYPESMLNPVREISLASDDYDFAMEFYRYQRMPGNFSLRHAVLSPLKAKISPFLDSRFIDSTYALDRNYYINSRLHRMIIESATPNLLPFFDFPIKGGKTVQNWRGRFSKGVGTIVYKLLDENLGSCTDLFSAVGVRALCAETIQKPSRAIYHLLRILSLILSRHLLKTERENHVATINENRVNVTGDNTKFRERHMSNKL